MTTNPYEPTRTRPPHPTARQTLRKMAIMGLVIALCLWPLAAIGLSFFAYDKAINNDLYIKLDNGRYMNRNNRKIWTAEQHEEGARMSAFAGGVCCPTVPFGLAVITCSVIILATRER